MAFSLSEDEGLAVAETASAFADAVPAGRDAIYRELAAQAVGGSVDDALIPTLEKVCVLALETGKARQLGKAETERLLVAAYRRTPGGSALSRETSEVNKVLTQLTGRELESVRISNRMPGRYLVDIAVDGIAIQLSIEPEGLEVRSVNTG
jgi:hypothetical protein